MFLHRNIFWICDQLWWHCAIGQTSTKYFLEYAASTRQLLLYQCGTYNFTLARFHEMKIHWRFSVTKHIWYSPCMLMNWNRVCWWGLREMIYGLLINWFLAILMGVMVIVLIKGLMMGGGVLINDDRLFTEKSVTWSALLMGGYIMNWNMVWWWGNV